MVVGEKRIGNGSNFGGGVVLDKVGADEFSFVVGSMLVLVVVGAAVRDRASPPATAGGLASYGVWRRVGSEVGRLRRSGSRWARRSVNSE